MKVLLKATTVLDPLSKYHGESVDILIENGFFKQIDTDITPSKEMKVISLPNLCCSQGWFDSSVSLGEPGYEERETLLHGLNVAARSGFTSIALQPNTHPIIDTNSSVGFITGKTLNNPVKVYPIGALTVKSEGIDLAELYDMSQAGAIAFGDYKKAIENPNLLKLALLYVQNFDGLVLSYPQDNAIAGKGMVHEEEQSTLLGLKGIPALAEELQIARDLSILEYTGGKLHIPTISTAKSVALIKEAKAKGLQVSCAVAVHHLLLTDQELTNFDTRFKVLPPLRTSKDTTALLEGIDNGTIDMISTDHQPIDIEHKKVEFDHAKYGTVGLESAFGILNNLLGTPKTLKMLTHGKTIFGIKTTPIEVGNTVDLALFSPEGKAKFTKDDILSTSKNSAFFGKETKGKVYGIIAHNHMIINS
ncbi:dihydroorotase family protein [Aquimarina sp. W85]|uniref:dihydroorotase n=1 Tax=Aquimarina rhodophyticola TaxID=3342246 RepID=UPI00366B7D1A